MGTWAAKSHSTSRAHPCLGGSFQPLLTDFASPGKPMSMYMSKGVSVCVEGLWGCVHGEGVYVFLFLSV